MADTPITFILSDDSINKSGSRILTAGIDIKEFKKNPVMLYNHHRSSNWDHPDILPIGRWVNIRKEGSRLLADAEFDMDDEFAAKIARKVEKKILSAASVGIRVVEVSTEPKHLMKGQTRATITKSRMMECSIVDIPGNGNALRLSYSDGDGILELSESSNKEKFNTIIPLINKKTQMKTIYDFFGLSEVATEAQILAAVTQLRNENSQYEQKIAALNIEVATLKGAEEKAKCEQLVDKAIADKKLTASQRDSWLTLAEGDYTNTAAVLDTMKGFKSLSSEIESSKTTDTTLNDADKFETKEKADELLAWKADNPEEFERCEKAYYSTHFE